MKCLILLLFVFLLSSCSYLFEPTKYDVRIYSDVDSLKFYVNNDTTKWYITPARISVTIPAMFSVYKNFSKDVIITAKKDSIEKKFIVYSSFTTKCCCGNYYCAPFGSILDNIYGKALVPPSDVTLEYQISDDYEEGKYSTWIRPEKGLTNIKFSLPEMNGMYLQDEFSHKNFMGLFGITAGYEYYYDRNTSFDINSGFIMTLPLGAIDIISFDTLENAFDFFANLQYERDYGILHLGAGPQFNLSYYHKLQNSYDSTYTYFRKYNSLQANIGLAFSVNCRLNKNIFIGVNYLPSFLSWNYKGLNFQYTHILFFDAQLKFELSRPSDPL